MQSILDDLESLQARLVVVSFHAVSGSLIELYLSKMDFFEYFLEGSRRS